MSIDLNTLSPADLEALISTAEKRKTVLKSRKSIVEVREKLARIASRENYTLTELFPSAVAANDDATKAPEKRASARGTKKTGKAAGKRGRPVKARTGSSVTPKYRNPDNENETWSGRGKPPRWMQALLAEGKNKDNFLI